MAQIVGVKKIGQNMMYVYDDGHMENTGAGITKTSTSKSTATKAVRNTSSNTSTSAVKQSNGDLGLWMTENQNVMGNQSRFSQGLANDYLDASERYLSMASDAQRQANEFNAEQAQIQRDWSEAMSATAHQREVADLRAAGLNPVISAYGSGASVGSGAAASSSNNLTSAFGNLAATAVSAVASLANTMETNATSYANAGLSYGANLQSQDTQMWIAQLQSNTNMSMNEATNSMNKYIAEMNQLNSKQIAQIAANANVSSAQVHAAASNYSAEIAYASAIKTAEMNSQTNKEIAEMQATKSFEGIGSDVLKKAANGISNFLVGHDMF